MLTDYIVHLNLPHLYRSLYHHGDAGPTDQLLWVCFCRDLAPLPSDNDVLEFANLAVSELGAQACKLCISANQRVHRAFTLSTSDFASYQKGLGGSLSASSVQPCTFVEYKQDGVSASMYAPVVRGGNSLLADQAEERACTRYIAEFYSGAISAQPTFIAGHRWDACELLAGIRASTFSIVGAKWPVHVCVAWPSELVAVARRTPQNALLQTWLVPLCTPKHWALLVLRRPCIGRLSWDVCYIDSLPRDAMRNEARAAVLQLSESFLLPVKLVENLREVEVDKQRNDWICGQRVAHHAKQALSVSKDEVLQSSHLAVGTDDAVLRNLKEDATLFRNQYASVKNILAPALAPDAGGHARGGGKENDISLTPQRDPLSSLLDMETPPGLYVRDSVSALASPPLRSPDAKKSRSSLSLAPDRISNEGLERVSDEVVRSLEASQATHVSECTPSEGAPLIQDSHDDNNFVRQGTKVQMLGDTFLAPDGDEASSVQHLLGISCPDHHTPDSVAAAAAAAPPPPARAAAATATVQRRNPYDILDKSVVAASSLASLEQVRLVARREGEALIATIIAEAKSLALSKVGVVCQTCDQAQAMRSLTAEQRDSVYEQMTAMTYDKALVESFGLNGIDFSTTSLHTHLCEHVKDVLRSLLSTKVSGEYVAAYSRRNSLATCSDKWTALACARIAKCHGLPRDGHVVHSLVQGRMRQYFSGPNSELEVQAVEGSDSEWNLAAHRCGLWILGHSSVGKDNVLAVHHYCMKQLRHRFGDLPCLNELDIGRLTYSGPLETLQDGRSPNNQICWMTWVNSEIKQCFGTGANDIRESDFCQLAEGVAMGKRIKDQSLRLVPNFWFAIGTHPRALHKYFGGAENGLLR